MTPKCHTWVASWCLWRRRTGTVATAVAELSQVAGRESFFILESLNSTPKMPEAALQIKNQEEIEHHVVAPPMRDVLIAGGLGGAIGDSVIYPLDTIKTRQQGAANIAKYANMWGATKSILRDEGLRYGIYRGYLSALLGSFPSTMLFFGAYETTKRTMAEHSGISAPLIHLTAGFLGDLAASVVYVPSEVLKTRFQLQGPYNNKFFYSGYNYKGLTDAVSTIIRTEGTPALFYGYKATLIRDLPFSALQFAFYEEFHAQAMRYRGSRDIGLPLELATGAAAGGLAGVITTPLDVVKTRIQTQTTDKIKSTVQGLRLIVKNEGILRLFSGVGPRLVWTSIQSSVMLVFYQAILRALEEEHTKFA